MNSFPQTRRVRVNVGCGSSPTPGWVNLDNSPTLRLRGFPRLTYVMRRARLLDATRVEFLRIARVAGVRSASASKLPFENDSVDVVYSSHMLEHLDRREARRFIDEALRVLGPGCVLRLVVPDLLKLAQRYIEDGDADAFIERTMLASNVGASWRGRLKRVLIGDRHHLWMYDAGSLKRMLEEQGFVEVVELPAGETRIDDPAGLDLAERSEESVYLEARHPL